MNKKILLSLLLVYPAIGICSDLKLVYSAICSDAEHPLIQTTQLINAALAPYPEDSPWHNLKELSEEELNQDPVNQVLNKMNKEELLIVHSSLSRKMDEIKEFLRK